VIQQADAVMSAKAEHQNVPRSSTSEKERALVDSIAVAVNSAPLTTSGAPIPSATKPVASKPTTPASKTLASSTPVPAKK